MKKYEYTTKFVRTSCNTLEEDPKALDDILNAYAEEGWRLFRYDIYNNWALLITFEREKA